MGKGLEALLGKLREIWSYLAAVVFLLVAGAALIYLPERAVPKAAYWLDTKTIFSIKNEARRTIAYIIGGVLAIIGIVLHFWRVRALEKQVGAMEKQILVAQEGQITERFTRAIEQLGHDKVSIRLGGIYALERIANDSDRDYWPIMETLTAIVRERAAWLELSKDGTEEDSGEEKEGIERPAIPWLNAKIKPSPDIQAILTVLGRRKYSYGKGELPLQHLDLHNTDLRGAALFNINLNAAFLDGAHLDEATFVEANMEWATLNRTHLKRALMIISNLSGASLSESHLEGAILSSSNLEGAILYGAHLEGANLQNATGLTWDQLAQAIMDEKTLLPGYLGERPPKDKGAKGNDEE